MYINLNKTPSLKKTDIKEQWYHIDVEGMKLGYVASEVSKILRGKYSPQYTRNMNMHINVIITNTDKICLAEKKWEDKKYYRHTGQIGRLFITTAAQEIARHGTPKLLKTAIRRMMSSNTLRRYLLKNLYIYNTDTHPHEAQKPTTVRLSITK